jgi:hypothetical protein
MSAAQVPYECRMSAIGKLVYDQCRFGDHLFLRFILKCEGLSLWPVYDYM